MSSSLITLKNGRSIGPGHPCFIIAEAGSNHDQNLDQAFKLIEIAADAGADAVKFQVFSADKIAADIREDIAVLSDAKFRGYGKTLHELYKRLEMPRAWLPKLKKRADACGIILSATPFDEEAVDALEQIDISFYKIASFELVHLPLIRYASATGKPIILSTGMATLEEIEDAVQTVERTGNDRYALLHCGIEYPPRMEDVHLAAMGTMRERFTCPIGYSDHTLGLTVPIAAVAMGATIIEKHFTLDKNLSGPDHRFSLPPSELKDMVAAIRDVQKAIGMPRKGPVEAEMIHLRRGRRSLFAARDIKANEIITKEMISVLRPATGLMPKYLDDVIGKRARVTISRNEPITWDKVAE